MAGTKVDNYSTASREHTNGMVKKNGFKKPEGSSSSTHSSRTRSEDERKSKIADSMRKFLEDDDDFDYLGSLTSKKNKVSSRDMSKHSTSSSRKMRNPTSYRKKSGSDHRRPIIPRSSMKGKPLSIRYEGDEKDEKPLSQTLMSSARKLVDTVKRAASPGRLRNRSKSPGPQKIRNSVRKSRPSSSGSSQTEVLTASPSSNSPGTQRSKSPGKLRKRAEQAREKTDESSPKSMKSRSRSKSPGKLRKRAEEARERTDESSPKSMKSRSRSKSPGKLKGRSGKMKGRSKSPGVHRSRRERPRRRPENNDENSNSNHTSTSRRRAHSTGPQKPERAKSRSRREGRAPRSSSSKDEGDEPIKERSYSEMQGELNRYRVKRNKSMDSGMAHRARKAMEELEDEEEDRQLPRRANSMMLSREKGRRGGKSTSLADLVQYSEEEIHSTSYFASNHVLINRERMKRGLRPLTRNIAMDDLARKSAEAMAASGGVDVLPTTYVGNVLKGETIRTIHRSTMLQKQGRERANILNPYFQDFGVGTCKGNDGQLYMCQLFSERLELALTDTTKLEDASDE